MSTSHARQYELKIVQGGPSVASFSEEVRKGLAAEPRQLSCRFLYDERGSHLFEEICEQPEYYPTRCEMEILERHAAEIVDGDLKSMIELGSGSARKARVVVKAALESYDTLDYYPIDVSRAALDMCGKGLIEEFSAVRVIGYCGVYEPALVQAVADSEQPCCVLWLGGSMGNMHRHEAAEFLAAVRKQLRPNDRVVVGIDLRKDKETLEAAYNDAQGVTGEFNLNLLHRINSEFDANFNIEKFAHHARYNSEVGRIEIQIESLEAQRVQIAKLGLDVSFAAGELFHTENSYKYSADEVAELAAGAGLKVTRRWFDAEKKYSLNEFHAS